MTIFFPVQDLALLRTVFRPFALRARILGLAFSATVAHTHYLVRRDNDRVWIVDSDDWHAVHGCSKIWIDDANLCSNRQDVFFVEVVQTDSLHIQVDIFCNKGNRHGVVERHRDKRELQHKTVKHMVRSGVDFVQIYGLQSNPRQWRALAFRRLSC